MDFCSSGGEMWSNSILWANNHKLAQKSGDRALKLLCFPECTPVSGYCDPASYFAVALYRYPRYNSGFTPENTLFLRLCKCLCYCLRVRVGAVTDFSGASSFVGINREDRDSFQHFGQGPYELFAVALLNMSRSHGPCPCRKSNPAGTRRCARAGGGDRPPSLAG